MGSGVPTAKSLCASTVTFRPGSNVSDITPDPSVDVSDWDVTKDLHMNTSVTAELDRPFDITGKYTRPNCRHVLSPAGLSRLKIPLYSAFIVLPICHS